MKRRYLLLCTLLFILPVLTLAGRSSLSKAASTKTVATPIIYIGDSRAEGLDYALPDAQKKYVIFYHATSQGYSWFTDQVAAKVTTQLYRYPSIKFRIVINLGINDHIGNIEQYVKKYNQLAKGDWEGYDIYIVSITPVDEAKMAAQSLYPQTNDQIQASNDYMKKNLDSSIHYIDLFSTMRNQTTLVRGFQSSADGAHYTPNSYLRYWKLLMRDVK